MEREHRERKYNRVHPPQYREWSRSAPMVIDSVEASTWRDEDSDQTFPELRRSEMTPRNRLARTLREERTRLATEHKRERAVLNRGQAASPVPSETRSYIAFLPQGLP